MNNSKIQWHPAFIATMDLEMTKNRDSLTFSKEYNLNVKPLEIDLLITKSNSNTPIDNEIGRIFKNYNIFNTKTH